MSSSKTEPKAIDDTENLKFNHQDVQAKKKTKILLKPPACRFTNRPKEVILIRGRDSACKQTLTFHQQETASRDVNMPNAPQHERHLPEWDTNILPERPRVPTAVKPERSQELVIEEDESGRSRKKLKRTLEE